MCRGTLFLALELLALEQLYLETKVYTIYISRVQNLMDFFN